MMLLQSQLLCWSGVQVEEIAVNKGLVVEEPGRRFEKGYKEHLWESYAFQLFIDFENKTVEPKIYDKK